MDAPGLEPGTGNSQLIIDETGVGKAVANLFSLAGLDFVGVTITGGNDRQAQAPDGIGWHVSKLRLVSGLQACLHSGELKIAKSLPEAATLAQELQNFRATISDAGYAAFGARVGKHDDLVRALCLALWFLVGRRGMGISHQSWPSPFSFI